MSILYSGTWLGVLQRLKFVLPKISMSQPSKTGSLDFVKISTAYDLKGDLVRLDHLRKCITTIRGLLLWHAGLSSVKETIKFQINMVLIVLDHMIMDISLKTFLISHPANQNHQQDEANAWCRLHDHDPILLEGLTRLGNPLRDSSWSVLDQKWFY